MHFIYNMLVLTIFMFLIFYFKIPNIDNDRYIYHKFMIFMLLFVFQFVIYLLSDISNHEIFVKKIATKSFIIGVAAVIGYSIFNDLMYAKIINTTGCSYSVLCINVTFMIMVFIALIKVIELVIGANNF